MKTSAIKMVQSYLSKKNINNLKEFINIRNIIISIFVLVVAGSLFYLSRPIFFDYESNKEFFKKKISNYLKIQTNIKGDISYSAFPTPRIVIKDLELNFTDSKKKPIVLKETNFLISVLKLKSLKEIEIKKSYVSNQRIEIFPDQLKNYLEYFQKYNVNNFSIKKSEIFFIDSQGNDISITDFNLKNTFNKEREKISLRGFFAQTEFKINFLNNKNKEKHLIFTIPDLNTNLKIIFNDGSNLEKASGKLNLKILDNILLLNFDGDKLYKISESYFRNKFLNSKLDGSINFKDNFYFDLNLLINQVNMRKLLLYYNSLGRDKNSNQINISKKINGKINIKSKKTDSFFGKIEDTNLILVFENGDLKIKSGSVNLGKNGKVKFNISLLGKGKDQRINFFINFLSNNGKKFLKKFNLNIDEKNISFNAVGKINVIERKIKFENLIVNSERIENQSIDTMESLFNQYVIQDSVWGFSDFFKIKKFLTEAYKYLE